MTLVECLIFLSGIALGALVTHAVWMGSYNRVVRNAIGREVERDATASEIRLQVLRDLWPDRLGHVRTWDDVRDMVLADQAHGRPRGQA